MAATNLLAPYAPVATNLPATPPLNVYTTEADSVSASFFRIHEE